MKKEPKTSNKSMALLLGFVWVDVIELVCRLEVNHFGFFTFERWL